MESEYLKKRREILLGQRPPDPKKEAKPIAKISEKKKRQMAEDKISRKDEDPIKEKWFNARRRELVGVCQCGCAQPSSKHDDLHFRASLAHIFPKAGFLSVAYHPLNFVERAYFGGCHATMDQAGLHKWPNMGDWNDIKERFYILAPLLADEERAKKFYTQLEALVYSN